MKIVINDIFKENLKKLVVLFTTRYFYELLGIQILSIEVYSTSKTKGFDIKFNDEKEILAIVLFLIVSYLFLRLKQNNHLNYFLNILLYYIYYIPINVAFAINDRDYSFCILTHIFYVLLMLSINRNTRSLNKQSINKKINYDYLRVFLMIISLLMIIYRVGVSDLSFHLGFEPNIIYALRANYVNNLSSNIIAYLFRLVVVHGATFCVPIYLYLSLKNKWYADVCLSFVCFLARYSLTYEKGIILLLPLVILSYIAFEKTKLNITKTVFRVATVGFVILESVYYLFSNKMIYYLIVCRVMFIPAWLNGIYYDFFKAGNKIWFSQEAVLLETFIPNTYSQSPLKLISEYYFGGKTPSPNSGLFAEAYMQAGSIGVFLFPFILCWIFGYIERIYRPFGSGIEFLVAGILVLTITNQPILSRGAVFSVLVPTILIHIFSRNIVYRHYRS